MDFYDVITKYGKLITAVKNEKLTKMEIADKNIRGINKSSVFAVVRKAVKDGLLLCEDDRYFLNKYYLLRLLRDFMEDLNISERS